MQSTITVRLSGRDDAVRLTARLRDVATALNMIGQRTAAHSRKAFEDQRLGDVIWPERSPKQAEPFINVAPVVRNAGRGQAPRADDFRRRPALGGASGDLAQSIASEVSGSAVTVGTTYEGASMYQFGGSGTIPITDRTREMVARFLGVTGARATSEKVRIGTRSEEYEQDVVVNVGESAESGSGLRMGKRKAIRRSAVYAPAGRSEYAPKLMFALDPETKSMTASAAPRPFIGWTRELETDVVGELAVWVGGEVTS